LRERKREWEEEREDPSDSERRERALEATLRGGER
jgi:hypothetical protein